MHMRMLYNMSMCMCAVATGQPTPTLNRMPLLNCVVVARALGLSRVAARAHEQPTATWEDDDR